MHTPLRVLVGALGPGVLPTAATGPPPAGTVLLDLGPEHPSGTGLVELRLWVADGTVTDAQVVVGAMHRGVEKLFEVRDYRQVLVLADRHDWQAPFAAELTVALTCEQMLGLEPPARAGWLRTLLAEHTRVLSHLGFLGWLPHRLGVDAGLREVREALRSQTAALSGNRVHPMLNRVGGLGADADDGWLDAEVALTRRVRATAARLRGLLDDPRLRAATAGVARLGRGVVEQYGVTGPAARATGLDVDLRTARPYLGYAELAGLITPTPYVDADAWSRLATLVQELDGGADLVDACAERLRGRPGPVQTPLGHIVKLPEGEAYLATEAPLGVSGVFLVSRGEKTPWRLKLRTPSFNHVAALEALLPGLPTTALEATLASVGYVVGDIDR